MKAVACYKILMNAKDQCRGLRNSVEKIFSEKCPLYSVLDLLLHSSFTKPMTKPCLQSWMPKLQSPRIGSVTKKQN